MYIVNLLTKHMNGIINPNAKHSHVYYLSALLNLCRGNVVWLFIGLRFYSCVNDDFMISIRFLEGCFHWLTAGCLVSWLVFWHVDFYIVWVIPIFHSAAAPPSQRVQFLLGEEEDEDHRTHDIFCEMAELFPAGDDKEWKETARSDFVKQFILQLANLRHEIVSDCSILYLCAF